MNIEDEFRFDIRIQQRLIKKGLVTEDELKARLEGLNDLESESEIMDLEQPGLIPQEPEVESERGPLLER